MKTPTKLIAFMIVLGAAAVVWCQTAQRKPAPVVGKSLRYCNPLPIEATSKDGSAQGVNLGDITVVPEGGKYYMFCSGGGGWVSENLVNWEYKGIDIREGRLPVAPHVVKFNGAFYMSGNNCPLYRASAILGPYELVGPWTDEKGQPLTGVSLGRPWGSSIPGSFDVDIFIDDDNKPYLYFVGRSNDGIYVVPLDPKEMNKFAAPRTHLFGFNRAARWEWYGDMNEYSDVAWIEGPWAIKHNGTYYVQHSAGGTQWITYATGVYTAKSPLGPFVQAPVNPLLRNVHGLVTGPGHGCVIKGPDGNWWQFYTIVTANPPGGRRIGMDPVSFDRNGNMVARGPTETPQWGPGAVADAYRDGNSGSIPLSVNKARVNNSHSAISSERSGHEAAYAVDNSNGTWWEPEQGDAQPSLTLDLGPGNEYDPPQSFTVDSSRIIFYAGRGGMGGGRAGAPGALSGATAGTPTAPPAAAPAGSVIAHQFKIEASKDGKEFTTILDKTANRTTKYIEFDELPPTVCRYVRLTITGWPRIPNTPLGIIEFTVFGKPVQAPLPLTSRGPGQ
jgi:xylan 1,4-beta-xylosidase